MSDVLGYVAIVVGLGLGILGAVMLLRSSLSKISSAPPSTEMSDVYLDMLTMVATRRITHIGLVNESGAEISVRRKRARWSYPNKGHAYLLDDLEFDVPPGAVVRGWHGFNAEQGGTDYGGCKFTRVKFPEEGGMYTLLAHITGIKHRNGC